MNGAGGEEEGDVRVGERSGRRAVLVKVPGGTEGEEGCAWRRRRRCESARVDRGNGGARGKGKRTFLPVLGHREALLPLEQTLLDRLRAWVVAVGIGDEVEAARRSSGRDEEVEAREVVPLGLRRSKRSADEMKKGRKGGHASAGMASRERESLTRVWREPSWTLALWRGRKD